MMARVAVIFLMVVAYTHGHGRMIDPPSRSSAWRYGYDTPVDYNDNQGFCGGIARQYAVNGGKCGICGDPWDAPRPRNHELGGKFATGMIVSNYTQGQQISVTIDITANHKGYFEFRICPVDRYNREATQKCLNRYPLYIPGRTKLRIPIGTVRGKLRQTVQLPSSLSCDHCVLQWRYVTGNNWGNCTDTKAGSLGCGPQEEFRACSDVTITRAGGVGGAIFPLIPVHSVDTSLNSIDDYPLFEHSPTFTYVDERTSLNTFYPNDALPSKAYHPLKPKPVTGEAVAARRRCIRVPGSKLANSAATDRWCTDVCNHVPVFCPPSLCKCYKY